MLIEYPRLDKFRMPVDVLLVDDDAVQAATRKAILERAGLVVKVATTGAEALEITEAWNTLRARLIITDHLMPGMNGADFVRGLRKAGYLRPVLVLSGFADVEEEYESLDVVLRVKPFPPDQLIALVKQLLNDLDRRTA